MASIFLSCSDLSTQGWLIRINGADFFATIVQGGFQQIYSGTTPVNNTWYYITFVRQGDNFGIAVNGVWGSTFTGSGSLGTAGNAKLNIGAINAGGYIDEVRITKGVARYTPGTNFSPPTGPFPLASSSGTTVNVTPYSTDTAYPGPSTFTAGLGNIIWFQAGPLPVSVLLHFDNIVTGTPNYWPDSSLNNLLVPTGGTTLDTGNYEFGPGSVNFSGYTGYVAIPNSVVGGPMDLSHGDFTVEGWVNQGVQTLGGGLGVLFTAGGLVLEILISSTSNNIQIVSLFGQSQNSATNSVPQNTWVSFALVMQSNAFVLYINGVAVAAPVSVTRSQIPVTSDFIFGGSVFGSSFIGNFDEIRVTKQALYTANYTPARAPFPSP